MSREAFLERVRAAAEQGRAYRVATRPLSDEVGYVGARGDLCEALAAEVIAVGGEAYLAKDHAAATEIVQQICRESGATSALCWQHPVLDRLNLAELLANASIELIDHGRLTSLSLQEQRSLVLAAGIGITSCDWAIAETGSLLMLSRPGQERIASLLPPVHIAIVERSQILPDLYDAIRELSKSGFEGLPSNAVFITGPSKTGDMELELTTGVHGPGRWCVVVVRT